VPEIVLSTHGRYVFAQAGGGWELRERVDLRRRARWVIAAALFGAAAVLWDRTRSPFAFALAALGAMQLLAGLRTKGRCLVIRDAEIAWGYAGDDPMRSAAWPRSRIACVFVERGSRLADPKLRRRESVWVVRIRARDGDLHPSAFAFASEPTARSLADTLARHLGVSVDAADGVSASPAPVNRWRRESARSDPLSTEPRPGRLDPR
jgi:hypothetical protein